MSMVPKQQIVDLVTEYLLHTGRKDLFVEGMEDRSVIEWFLESVSISGVRVLEIDCVEITAEDLRRHGLNEGNKSRVLVLAREFINTLPETASQVLCVVDADFDYILNRIETNRFLAYTDGTSLEMYAFSEAALKRVLWLGFRDSSSNAALILDTLYGVLKEIFVIRAVNESLQLGMKWIPFERRCKMETDGKITFNIEKFIGDYLRKNGQTARLEEFDRCRNDLLSLELSSRWRWIRGHDFAHLLARYIRGIVRTKEAKEAARGEAAIRMLFVALDPKYMLSTPLFQRIVGLFANPS